MYAASHDAGGALKALLQGGADGARKSKYGTALHTAVHYGKGANVEALLAGGLDVDAVDAEGRTPLSWAAETGNAAIADRLLAAGANPAIKDRKGRTPLAIAKKGKKAEVVELIQAKGRK